MRKNRVFMLALIVIMAIGFAAVTTSLLIKGNIGIGLKEKDFDVYFSNVYLNDIKHNEFISPDGKNITFKTDKLINVGEQVILKYEIMNSSTQYDANIDLNFNPISLENEYISVDMNKEYENDIIKASEKGIGTLIITLKKSVIEDNSLNFTIDMNANATEVDISKSNDVIIKNDKPGEYSFTGTITNGDNTPIKNKPVVIISGNGIHYTETDLEGNIYMDDLAEGTQEVYIFNDYNLEEVKNMTEEEIKTKASEKITLTTSTTGNASGENYQIGYIEFDQTESIETVSIKIGDNTVEKVLKEGDILEFNVDSNETEIEISGLGTKPLQPGENIFELELEDGKTITIVVNNVRPNPPIITGGSEEYVNDTKAVISLEKSGNALSDVDYYEYYISETEITDFSNITPTGTTDNIIEITTEGTKYVYYRTVSKNGTVSNWSNSIVVKLDYSSPNLEITSVTTSSNRIIIKYNATDEYSGIKSTTCELGEESEFTKQGTISNGICTFNNLTTNKLYNYRICVEDNASNDAVCKIGEAITKEIKNPVISFDNNVSVTGDYYLGQTAKISFDGTGVENPTFYIKSTRAGTSNINLTKSCGNGDSPGVCTDISSTTKVTENMWYQVDGNLNINYSEACDEYSQIIALVYDGYNYSNKTTGTIGKIAYAAIDLEYSNQLVPNITNVQEAIDELYSRLR